MDISTYTKEDFVLDPAFRKWVLQPSAESNLFWEDLLTKHPSRYKAAKQARLIILQMNKRNQAQLSETEILSLWKDIEKKASGQAAIRQEKVIPLNSLSTFERNRPNSVSRSKIHHHFGFRVACVLLLSLGLGYFSGWLLLEPPLPQSSAPPTVHYLTHTTVPGVKSHLTLSDGSRVILNSGSELRYLKNFEKGGREVFLKGEAFFDVAKDLQRPFRVHSRKTTTTALGTSFNVKAYEGETLGVSLLTGKVAVNSEGNLEEPVLLVPGEALKIDTEKNRLVKSAFNPDRVIGWTKKRIVFKETPLLEAIRVLENWYGVQIRIVNRPGNRVLLSGKFQDETLENVLEGLKFSARFDFDIEKENVTIQFME
ncbi:FecR family protein [Cyclobacterium jeungdonense]|uniref:FecR domain-containing protein n=1 Tax=Cyclobacterium jeungdonense TaxID=708087 RepID=A0ABT8CE89_9BACT|nr:FecR domain-containing protein [Cyclobacterium jeungdonense]MDN3690502.1 FecR domain-containing protein [Cyclobacterium jeungdonense]